MLAFHLHCQLGNQMFIYACAVSLAKEKRTIYCLSELGDLKYFELSKNDYRWNSLKWMWFRVKNVVKKFQFEHFQDNRKDYSSLMVSTPNNDIWYYGYFQGEKYFFSNPEEIKRRFQIKEQHLNEFKKIRSENIGNEEYTIIHIRLKDYQTFGPEYLGGPNLTLPFSYYHDLIKSVSANNNKLVFLSDDIEVVKKEFSYANNAYFSDNSPIIDMQFIMHAKTCILSCSTFSWWGAWLNKNQDKKIYVPEYFLGYKVKKEYPVNMIPSSWNKIEIQN